MSPKLEAMGRIESIYSNYDHVLHEDVIAELRSKPNQAVSHYPGWDFSAWVYFDGENFCCEVWVHRQVQEVIIGTDIKLVIERVKETYGYE